MFNIGDKVVYPMHGAGIIEGIEEKEESYSIRSISRIHKWNDVHSKLIFSVKFITLKTRPLLSLPISLMLKRSFKEIMVTVEGDLMGFFGSVCCCFGVLTLKNLKLVTSG